MKTLEMLLERLEYEIINGSIDRKVSEIVCDSRKLTKDCLFVCVRGFNVDGHIYANDAEEAGAAVIVAEETVAVKNATLVLVKDSRYALAVISAAYFDYPYEKLTTIAITGTKGKTTTAYMIKNILEEAGHKTGLIGTIEIDTGSRRIHATHSTPESYLIHKYMFEMLESGCKYLVMEASSQGFKLNRTAGILFDIGVFTNLEKDHIGNNEHADLNEYIFCKSMLFKQCRTGIINIDDKRADSIIKGHKCKIVNFGFDKKADYRAENIKLINAGSYHGLSYEIKGKTDMEIEIHVPGRFNVYNSLCAASVCDSLEIKKEDISRALIKAHVKGRVEPVHVSDKFALLIDYAHNAMALESVLKTLKEYKPERLVCVFGCGGNRSRDRRFEMGEVSGMLADFTIITSDNPRYEEPMDIIGDIVTGIKKTEGNYCVIADRKEAIKYAIINGRKGDIIILAGKGHEDYQEICGVKYPMDERVIIADILKDYQPGIGVK